MTTQENKLNNRPPHNWLILAAGLLILIVTALFFISNPNLGPRAGSLPVRQASEESAVQSITLLDSGPPLQTGDLPYRFTLENLEGNQVALDQLIGRPIILNFWATWCGPCRIEMPHLQNTFTMHQADGLRLLALNQDETAVEVSEFFDEFGLTFTPLLDQGQTVSENYGIGRTLPTTFFINAAGEITAIHRGPMTQSQIDDYLALTMPTSQ